VPHQLDDSAHGYRQVLIDVLLKKGINTAKLNPSRS